MSSKKRHAGTRIHSCKHNRQNTKLNLNIITKKQTIQERNATGTAALNGWISPIVIKYAAQEVAANINNEGAFPFNKLEMNI